MQKNGWIVFGIVTGIVGSIYVFVPRKTIASVSRFFLFDITVLGHRILQNDLILFGTVMLIISFVNFYKVYRLMKK